MLFIEDPIIYCLENYSINKLSPLYITVNFVHQISIIINNFINNSKNFSHIPTDKILFFPLNVFMFILLSLIKNITEKPT